MNLSGADPDQKIKADEIDGTACDDESHEDQSARMTLPDIDGVILATAARLAAKKKAPDTARESRDNAETAALTIPPSSDYGTLVAMTQSEEALLALKQRDFPQISVDEATLKEQLLLDPSFLPALRVVSLLEEAGLMTDSYIAALEKFTKESERPPSDAEICALVMMFFGNLADSLLVVLDKRRSPRDDTALAEAEKMIPEDLRDEKGEDKPLVLTLRVVTKLAEIYKMRSGFADNGLYEKFTDYLKA